MKARGQGLRARRARRRILGSLGCRLPIFLYAAARCATILARFTEVESGRNPDRPVYAKALHLAKVTGVWRGAQ